MIYCKSSWDLNPFSLTPNSDNLHPKHSTVPFGYCPPKMDGKVGVGGKPRNPENR